MKSAFQKLSEFRLITLLSIPMASLLFLSACNKSGGDNNNNGSTPTTTAAPTANSGYATTPQPCNAQQVTGQCYNQGNLQLPNSWSYGAWQWPTQWQPSYGNCGCPTGFTPIYHGSFGMACAPNAYFNQNQQNYNGGYSSGYGYSVQFNWGFNWGASQNTQGNNIPQTNYSNTYNNTCGQNSVARGCDTRTAGACGWGVCQPVGGGSTIGICVDNWY